MAIIHKIDRRAFRVEAHEAVESCKTTWALQLRFELLIAMYGVHIPKRMLTSEITNIIRFRSIDDTTNARRSVDALCDYALKPWYRLCVLLIVALIIGSVVAGIVWGAIALYHWTVGP